MAHLLCVLGVAAATLISTTHSLATFTPLTSNSPTFQLGIPSSSTVSASSNGALYFQISAPTSYQWVAFGIGEEMAGAKIFVVYADGKGNVTVSGRDGGQGHVQPLLDQGIQSGVELLAGSGIVGENMVANFKCDSVTLDSSKDSSASPFIAAWMVGNPLNSASTSASIRQHSGNARRQVTLDLSKAVLASDTNPFVQSSGGSSNPGGSGSTGSGSSSTGSGPGSTGSGSGSTGTGSGSSPKETQGDGGSTSSGSSGGAVVVGTSGNTIAMYEKAHGIIMGLVVVLLFPLGAIYMRLGGSALIHGGLQIVSLCLLVVGFGLGVKLGQVSDLLYNTAHTIFGTIIFALFLIQPLLGIAHHLQHRRSHRRNPISHLHIWYGRVILVLGVVNGGLGLRLADNSTGGTIAYGVVAGVVGVAYVVAVAFKRKDGGGGRRVRSADGNGAHVDGGEGPQKIGNGRTEKVSNGNGNGNL